VWLPSSPDEFFVPSASAGVVALLDILEESDEMSDPSVKAESDEVKDSAAPLMFDGCKSEGSLFGTLGSLMGFCLVRSVYWNEQYYLEIVASSGIATTYSLIASSSKDDKSSDSF
jgi:hypothetical protein